MAFSFPKLSWLWLGGKEEKNVSNESLINSFGMGEESINMKLNSNGQKPSSKSSLNRKSKRKWKSRGERSKMIDKEYDVVLVPSDGVSLSGSESDDSDWSVGWLEPHGPGFKADHEADDSFAVLVPCYRNNSQEFLQRKDEGPFFRGHDNIHNGRSNGINEYMEQWLSSLQKY